MSALSPCPYDPVVTCAHLRAADLWVDIAAAARAMYRRLTDAEVSEIHGAVVKILIDQNRSDLWLTEDQFISLCRNHSHR